MECYQSNRFYNVPVITEDTVLVGQMQETDKGIIATPSGDDSPLICKTKLKS